LKILPASSRVPEGGARSLRAVALDQDGRPARDPFRGEWRLSHPELGMLVPAAEDPARAIFRAGDRSGQVTIIATERIDAAHEVSATAEIDIVATPDPLDARGGIPRPEPLHRPTEDWRSRLRGATWEYNVAHRDYVAVRDDPRRRLQYLVHLFAKELVLRNFGSPGDGAVLEKMIEVLTHVDQPRMRSK